MRPCPDYRGGDRRLCGYVPRPTTAAGWFELLKLAAQRFWSKVDRRGPDECWPWLGHCNRDGYGNLKVTAPGNRPKAYVNFSAHVAAWELANGLPVADGMVVRHSCDNPPCCNPAHLLEGSQADNVHDREDRGRGVRQRGEHAPRATLTEELVRTIWRMSRAGKTCREIQVAIGRSYAAVNDVLLGKSWTHVRHEDVEAAE